LLNLSRAVRRQSDPSLQHILVPLDISEIAEAAMPIARELGSSVNAVLNLIAVSPDIEPGRTRKLPVMLVPRVAGKHSVHPSSTEPATLAS
jgi:nucleotide-binding universal stress UspA family protein